MNYAKLTRMRFIDFLLDHYGTINRAQISDYFGVHTVQASNDLNEYRQLAPGNMAYDLSAKTYKREPGFKRAFP